MNIYELFKKIESPILNLKDYDYVCFFDGACVPVNPYGNIGIGVAIYNGNGEVVNTYSSENPPHENNSNNVAEYKALYKCLSYLYENNLHQKKIIIFGDSKLVVNQINKLWAIKDGSYTDYAIKVNNLFEEFTNIDVYWIPRELNFIADGLSREKLVMYGDKGFKLSEYKKLSNQGVKEKVDFLLNRYMSIILK